MRRVKLAQPEVTKRDLRNVKKAVHLGELSMGTFVREFEEKLSQMHSGSFAFSVSSCTTGLQLILAALDLPPGSEVCVPNFTFPATVNVVLRAGLKPVLVDIGDDYCMDPDSLSRSITRATRAVIVVHAFGHIANMTEILKITEPQGIALIEDAACAIGAQYMGAMAGTFGLAAAFSFHPRKVVTTGEGGAVLVRDASLANRIALLRSHGGVRGKIHMEFVDVGFNFRMSDINAALGLPQLIRLSGIVKKRNALAIAYGKHLAGLPITLPSIDVGHLHSFQSYVIRVENRTTRDALILHLRSQGVEVAIGTYALSEQPAYKNRASIASSLDRSVEAYYTSLALPMSSRMSPSEVRRVSRVVSEFFSG